MSFSLYSSVFWKWLRSLQTPWQAIVRRHTACGTRQSLPISGWTPAEVKGHSSAASSQVVRLTGTLVRAALLGCGADSVRQLAQLQYTLSVWMPSINLLHSENCCKGAQAWGQQTLWTQTSRLATTHGTARTRGMRRRCRRTVGGSQVLLYDWRTLQLMAVEGRGTDLAAARSGKDGIVGGPQACERSSMCRYIKQGEGDSLCCL